jgi:hypothetical protein
MTPMCQYQPSPSYCDDHDPDKIATVTPRRQRTASLRHSGACRPRQRYRRNHDASKRQECLMTKKTTARKTNHGCFCGTNLSSNPRSSSCPRSSFLFQFIFLSLVSPHILPSLLASSSSAVVLPFPVPPFACFHSFLRFCLLFIRTPSKHV